MKINLLFLFVFVDNIGTLNWSVITRKLIQQHLSP